jgi:SAM-dependent methyltransferase
MSTPKTEKELAFLHDLYVATDWGERFAELMDEHVKLPERGQALYVASGKGGHALVCVDESPERLELARAKAEALKDTTTEFRHALVEALPFEDEQFDLVVGDASLVAPERVPEMLAEMVRVAAHGATVALNLATASSFGEFFSVYWEALANRGYNEQAAGVGSLINELPTVSDVEGLAAREGLDGVASWTRVEEFDYKSGEEFLNAPLVRRFLLGRWVEALPGEEAREDVLGEVARIVDEERREADFILSVKATIVVGRKAE